MLKLGEHQPDTPFELNEVFVGSSIRRLGRKFKGKITFLENRCSTVTAHSDINTNLSNSLLCHLVSHLKKVSLQPYENPISGHTCSNIQTNLFRAIRTKVSTDYMPTDPAVVPSENIIREFLLTKSAACYARIIFPCHHRLLECLSVAFAHWKWPQNAASAIHFWGGIRKQLCKFCKSLL